MAWCSICKSLHKDFFFFRIRNPLNTGSVKNHFFCSSYCDNIFMIVTSFPKIRYEQKGIHMKRTQQVPLKKIKKLLLLISYLLNSHVNITNQTIPSSTYFSITEKLKRKIFIFRLLFFNPQY